MTLLLASQSPRRKSLLSTLGIPFEVLPPPKGVDMELLEAPRDREQPLAYVKRVTRAKLSVMRQLCAPSDTVLVADTTVTMDGLILGKPLSALENERMLRLLSGRTHRVMTAVAIGCGTFGLVQVGLGVKACSAQTLNSEPTLKPCNTDSFNLITSKVTFAPLTEQQITHYIKTQEGFDKAGGYAIQGLAAPFVRHISGDYSAIVGLPLHATATLLAERGFHAAAS